MSRRRLEAWLVIVAMVLAAPGTAHAYIHLGFDNAGQNRPIKWNVPSVLWYANDRTVPGVSPSQFQAELAQAFTTWQSVPTATIAFQFAGFTSATPLDDDSLSVFGFQSAPEMDRVLGATTFAGLGLLIASRASTLEAVSGLMNLVMLPMWLLSGIFFPSDRFPSAVQPLIKALPLTALNDSLRAVMQEGATLASQLPQIGLLAAWSVVTFVLALKWFRWV